MMFSEALELNRRQILVGVAAGGGRQHVSHARGCVKRQFYTIQGCAPPL